MKEKTWFILDATKQHATNLAAFVALYKSLMLLMRHLSGGKEHSYHSFVAGAVGGGTLFQKNSNVNQQESPYRYADIRSRSSSIYSHVHSLELWHRHAKTVRLSPSWPTRWPKKVHWSSRLSRHSYGVLSCICFDMIGNLFSQAYKQACSIFITTAIIGPVYVIGFGTTNKKAPLMTQSPFSLFDQHFTDGFIILHYQKLFFHHVQSTGLPPQYTTTKSIFITFNY